MNLESPKITVDKSSNELFDYLSKVENFEKIMPENTDKFEALEDGFVFALKGMPQIKLKMMETEAPQKIVLGSTSEKFPFSLTADIQEVGEEKCEAQLLFTGEFKTMVAMMVKNPLQRFIDTLVENIGNS